MIKRILVGVCRSPAQSAVAPITVSIAARHHACVTAHPMIDANELAPLRPPSTGVFPSKIKARQELFDKAAEELAGPLRAFREQITGAGLAYEERGAVDGAQAAEAGAEAFDLTLANAWRFQDLLILSSAPWLAGEKAPRDVTAVLHALANGVRPILAVPPYAAGRCDKAMVALSGSLDSAKALKQFVQLAPWPDMALHLVTAGTPKNGGSAEDLLAEAAAFAQEHGFTVTTAALADAKKRSELLLREASDCGADVLVLGSSISRFLMRERFGTHVQQLTAGFAGPVFLSH